ncbi:MAG: lipopolysaccharide biosynthesis protein [Chloroflexi bacterium]|nr:lipopolysaccharide biosynthesis protein [Chloroflexota bacterium]
MTLRAKVTTSVFWVGLSMVGSRALAFLVQIVLARILVPEYFGLVHFATLTMEALQLFGEMGFSAALVYRKDRVRAAADVTFYVALGMAVVFYGLTYAGAPLAAEFFRTPEVREVLRALGVVMVINALGQVHFVLLARELDFRRQLLPDLVPALGYGLVAISLALSGMGVWSLVVGRIFEAILRAALVWMVVPWRPRWRFDRALAREMFDYGRHIIASKLLVFAITNVDDLFVGRMTGAAGMGYYGMAYGLSNLPATQITRVVNQVMFPALSQLQDQMDRMRRAFFQSMRYVSLLAIPITVATIVFAHDFVHVVYGAQWAPSIPAIQFLGVYGGIRAVAANMGNVFKAGGKPQWLTGIALWRLATMLLFLYPATKGWGFVGVAALSAVVAVVDFGVTLVLVNRILRAPWLDYLRALGPILLTSLLSAGLAVAAQHAFAVTPHARIRLAMAALIMGVAYVVVTWVWDRELRQMVAALVEQVRQPLGLGPTNGGV